MEGERSDDRELIRCAACRREIEEAEAQAQRWGYWPVGLDLYPFCPACAAREFDSHLAQTD